MLGTLFRSRDFIKSETELVVIVTPYMVRPTARQNLARPDDGLAPATDLQGQFPRPSQPHLRQGQSAAGRRLEGRLRIHRRIAGAVEHSHEIFDRLWLRPADPRCLALAVTSLLRFALPGCRTLEDHRRLSWPAATPIDAAQRHPIMVSQQPATIIFHVARGCARPDTGAEGAGRRTSCSAIAAPMRATASCVIAVPSGSPNESAAMRAVADMRRIISDFGFSDSTVAIQPYHGEPRRAAPDPPLPICATSRRRPSAGTGPPIWPTTRAICRITNFGCAQQHNLAAQIANPADLLGPRTMDPADAERRSGRHRQVPPRASRPAPTRSADENVSASSANNRGRT